MLLSAAAIVFIWRTQGAGLNFNTLSTLLHPNLLGALGAVAVIFLWWGFAGLRLKLLAQDMGGQVTLSRAIRAYLLGLFSASVTPAATGSSLATGWYLGRYLTSGQAAGIAIYTIVLDLVFYVWALPAAFIVLVANGVDLGIPGLGWYVTVFAVFAAGLSWSLAFRLMAVKRVLFQVMKLRALRRRRKPALRFLERTRKVLAEFNGMSLAAQLGLHGATTLLYFFHFLAFNMVAVALGISVNHVNIIALQVLVVALSFLVPTPGGSGYFEVALGVALSGQVPAQAKVLLILVWRLVSYWLYFIIGPAIGGMALLRGGGAGKSVANQETPV